MSGFEPPLSCSQSGPGDVSHRVLSAHPNQTVVAGQGVAPLACPSYIHRVSTGIWRCQARFRSRVRRFSAPFRRTTVRRFRSSKTRSLRRSDCS